MCRLEDGDILLPFRIYPYSQVVVVVRRRWMYTNAFDTPLLIWKSVVECVQEYQANSAYQFIGSPNAVTEVLRRRGTAEESKSEKKISWLGRQM